MRKIIFILSFLLTTCILYSQSEFNKVVVSDYNYFIQNKIENENGNIIYDYQIKDGIQDGNYEIYFKDDFSQLYMKGTINKGVRQGLWKQYNEFGILASETEFNEGLKEGTEKKYDLNGNIIEESNYQNNELNGNRIQFFPDGRKRTETQYENGLPVGRMKIYSENGELIQEIKLEK